MYHREGPRKTEKGNTMKECVCVKERYLLVKFKGEVPIVFSESCSGIWRGVHSYAVWVKAKKGHRLRNSNQQLSLCTLV